MDVPGAVFPQIARRPGAPRPPAAWDTLDSLLNYLQSSEQASGEVPAVLRAVRRGTAADAVYHDPGTDAEPVACAGPEELTPEHCRRLTARLLAGAVGLPSELLRAELPAAPD